MAETIERKRGIIKTRQGMVVSDKMDKTVVVAVRRQVKHAAYGKYVRRTSKILAHDKDDGCHIGDMVEITETRPLSKNKRWKVTRVLSRAE